MNFTNTLSSFQKYLEKKGRSDFTITAYRKDLEQLVEYLEKNKIKSWVDANTRTLEKYFIQLNLQGFLSPKSISRKMNSTKTFYKYLISTKEITNDYSSSLKHPKFERPVPRVLSPLEYKALRDTARSNLRLFTIIELLLQTGIRIGELSRLRKEDINETITYITVQAYSSSLERKIPVNPVLQESILKYFNSSIYNSTKSKYVFFTRTGNPILIRNIRSGIHNAFKSTGIKDATVNDLRTTFIIYQLENGIKIDKLAEIVGHQKQTTTEHYLELIKSRPQKTTNRITPL